MLRELIVRGYLFVQAGAGAIAEAILSRLGWRVYLTDYLSNADRATLLAGGAVVATTAFTNFIDKLQTAARPAKGIIPAGNYVSASWPQITKPIAIEGDGSGVVQITHAGGGILLDMEAAHGADGAPNISGFTLIAAAGTTILWKHGNTYHGKFDDVVCDGANVADVVGFEIRDGAAGGGSYFNQYGNCFAHHCGTNWRLKTYNVPGTPTVNDNTFVNCKGQSANWTGATWAALAGRALGDVIIPTDTGGNFGSAKGAPVFSCTVAGASGAVEPDWSTATKLGDVVVDGGATWTRRGWDDSVNVPSPGIGLLASAAKGNTFSGGDMEGNKGFQMAFVTGSATDTKVNGTWIEQTNVGVFATHNVLLDNVTAASAGSAIDRLEFLPNYNGQGKIDGLGWLRHGSRVVQAYDLTEYVGSDVKKYTAGDGSASDVSFGRIAASTVGVAFDKAIRSGAAATATLNASAGTIPQGAFSYDTTLNRPVFTDGAAWRYVPLNTQLNLGNIAAAGVATADFALADYFLMALTGATATIAAPLNPKIGQYIAFEILNSSGGAVAITWDAAFMKSHVAPANTKRNVVGFRYNGTKWVQHAPQGPDV